MKIYSDYLDKKNNTEVSIDKVNTVENKIEAKKIRPFDLQSKKTNNQIDLNNSQQNYDIKSKKTNNSSQNFLIRNNSRLIPEKFNQSSKGELITNNLNSYSSTKVMNFKNILNSPATSSNNSSNIQLKKTINIHKMNSLHINNSGTSETNFKDNFEDDVLDRSNKVTIYIIKIHSFIIIFFLIIIIGYSIYKLRNNTIFISQYERFYSDFHIVEERYSSLYYYWNTLKTIIIFNPKEERWKNMSFIMEQMNSNYEKRTNNYNQLLTKDMDFYDEVEQLFEIFTYNKNDSIEYLQRNICMNDTSCIDYLTTNDSIFNSGIDFGYKICFSYLNNIFMDYQSIKNKTSIKEIRNTITDDKFYEYKRMRLSFSKVFYYLKVKIFDNFINEAIKFGHRYKKVVLALNIISLIISILVLMFVIIFIFITVSNFSQPIKDSVYRINHSFFYIKNYSLTKTIKRYIAYFIFHNEQ